MKVEMGLLLLMSSVVMAQQPKNILVIMTDDQRWDTVAQMPKLSAIAQQGVTFPNAHQPTPLCGPSRSILFSGGYHMQDTGVYGNNPPNGGAKLFYDKTNLGVMLQNAGYKTMFIGKWVNGYEGMGKYVPPGWNTWIGRHSYATISSWFNFQYVKGTSTAKASSTGTIVNSNKYTTYYERDAILAALNSDMGNPSKPFFILWMPSAPHEPATPAPEDANTFSTYLYRGRGVGETDLSDKPKWVQNYTAATGGLGAYGNGWGDPFIQKQLDALQGVDRSIAAVINQLQSNGQWANTVVIYSSDNGYQWGEHGLWGKAKPYEESLHVPFFVFMPGVAPRTDPRLVEPSLDIGPTLFDIAGIKKTTQGTSIVPLLNDPTTPWRSSLYIEESDNNLSGAAIFAGTVNPNNTFVEYWTGEEELYDLISDPYQLRSLDKDPTQATLKASMLAQTVPLLGLAIVPVNNYKTTKHGTAFSNQMRIWGGFAPFTWVVASGALPPGIKLNRATGLLSGVPTTPGTYNFSLRVTDSALSPQNNAYHTFVTRVNKLVVN